MVKYDTLIKLLCSLEKEKEKGITFINENSKDYFISYSDMYEEALFLLGYIQQVGIKSGDKILLQLNNNFDFIRTLWACILGGIIPVTAPLGYSEEHRIMIFKLLKMMQNSYLVVNKELIEYMNDVLANKGFVNEFESMQSRIIMIDAVNLTPKKGVIQNKIDVDKALIQFSSGSTGNPKGVVLTYRNLMSNIYAIIKASKQVNTDSTLSWMPLSHGIGLIGFHLTPLAANINQHIMDTRMFLNKPISWLKKASEYKVTFTSSPNFGFKYILENFNTEVMSGVDLSAIKLIYNGAEPVSVELCKNFLNIMSKYKLKNCVMFPVYGMTEASLAISFPLVGETLNEVTLNRKNLSIDNKIKIENFEEPNLTATFVNLGYPVEDCQVRICNDCDEDVGEEVIGNIQIKGKNVFLKYFNNEDNMNNYFTKDKWFKTGDVGCIINSRLIVTGRKKDIIFVNGSNFYPQDLERIAAKQSGIKQEFIIATSIFNELLQKDEIILFIASSLSKEEFCKVIKKIKKGMLKEIGLELKVVIPISNIPKTNSGKPQRFKLAKKYLNKDFDSIIQEYGEYILFNENSECVEVIYSETEKQILDICIEILGDTDIGLNNNLIEYGGNSIKLTQIHSKLEKIYPNKITIGNIFSYPTIKKLAEFIDQQNKELIETIQKPIDLVNRTIREESRYDKIRSFIVDERLSNLINMSNYLDVHVKDILTGIFIYSLYVATDNPIVSIQTLLTSENMIVPISVNINNIENMMEIFTVIKRNCEENNGQTIFSEISQNSSITENHLELQYIICEKKLINNNQFLNIYDVILTLDITDKYINLEWNCNNKMMLKELISDLCRLFDEILDNMIANFNLLVE
ncbi:Acyl-CoA synthetase (AMP-forming)/AMP-acid ligase II [Clostridium cavendishii DSM 21758]|uniref:Acyl-CoA synthetase (AMP-forming)/AMP-acid ligase II n=1 Tax=Clostridium cavendishii DSM 21758 TaxID=1121302 RepID=A0A1M6KWG9_9CLOT|nr:non-ribosomal peptide synthetase [Clostridium cavendishii]SHJ63244.1 Acyl-CoA synthetase (AMP-forming)/AMP-acid ligase II [Clostridium cavendishii DSM 21758]